MPGPTDGPPPPASTPEWHVDIADVVKVYGKTAALQGVSLKVAPGESIALIGPNGAGKSTLVEILMGLRAPDAGRVTVLGHDVVSLPRGHVDRLGIQLQETRLFDKVTPRDYLRLFDSLYSRSVDVDELVELMGLADFMDKQIRSLSGGQRQRISLALAFVNDPELIILDEPTVGLDPLMRSEFWRIVRKFSSRGKTLIFSTHYMEEAEALATRIVMISDGRFVAQGTAAEIIGGTPSSRNLSEAYEYFALTA